MHPENTTVRFCQRHQKFNFGIHTETENTFYKNSVRKEGAWGPTAKVLDFDGKIDDKLNC